MRKEDREFRLPAISHLDFKVITMDRVLTTLFPRLIFSGALARERKRPDITLDRFVKEFIDPDPDAKGVKPDWFRGFAKYPHVVRAWVNDNLMDVVNRGRSDSEKIAAPRPLHLDTYKFRNPKYCRDYGASQQLYWMLYHSRQHGQAALEELKRFFRVGVDPLTDQDRPTMLDVETQALMRLSTQIGPRVRDDDDRERSVPLCLRSCDCLAEDVLRLLAYQDVMPRSVLVEYIKSLFALHLALYHLRLSTLLPAMVASGADTAACSPGACPGQGLSGCRGAVGIVVDVANQAKTDMAALAEQSAEHHYRRTHSLLKAYYQIRKLADFADHMERANRLPRPEHGQRNVSEILMVLAPHFAGDREAFFKQRLFGLLDHLRQGEDDDIPAVVSSLEGLSLDPFDKYIEVILALRGEWQRQYIVQCLDSLLLKNRDGAMLAQPRTKNAKRRFVFDSRMIEVLLQVLVVDARDGRFVTRKLHLDEVVNLLAQRYGIYLDRLPSGDGFSTPSIADRTALRGNLNAFKAKLREIGFLRDLSDAYTSLTITPRYDIAGVADA